MGTHLFVCWTEDLQLSESYVERRACEMDVAVVSVSADDDDIDCACEGGWVDVLVVLVRGADCGTDCTTKVVHRGGQDHLWGTGYSLPQLIMLMLIVPDYPTRST